MQKAIDFMVKNLKEKTIEISAQTYLIKFYNDLGFKETGEKYLEDNIPHIRMMYRQKEIKAKKNNCLNDENCI